MPKEKRIYEACVMQTIFKKFYISAYNKKEAWDLAEMAFEANDPRISFEKIDEPDLVDVFKKDGIDSIEDIPYKVDDYVKKAMVVRENEIYKLTPPIETSTLTTYICNEKNCQQEFFSRLTKDDATCPTCGEMYPKIKTSTIKTWNSTITHPQWIYSGSNKMKFNCDNRSCPCKKYYSNNP